MFSRRPIARCGAACRSLLPGPGWPLAAGQVRNEVPALNSRPVPGRSVGIRPGHPRQAYVRPAVAEKAAVTCNRLIWLSGGHKTVNRVLKASGYRW